MLLAGPGLRTCAQRRRHRLACLGGPGEAVHQAVKAGVVWAGVDCTATWIFATDRAGLGFDRGRGPRRSAVRVVGVVREVAVQAFGVAVWTVGDRVHQQVTADEGALPRLADPAEHLL